MNIFKKIVIYFQESIKELKKVVWPSRKATIKQTIIVIGVSLGTALFLGALDYLFQIGIQKIV